MEPRRGFPLFLNLPYDLRLQVWETCLPVRIVEFDPPAASPLRDESACTLATTSRLNTQPPVVSRICRESRRVFISQYRVLALDLENHDATVLDRWSGLHPDERFIRASADTINLDKDACSAGERRILGDGLRKLASLAPGVPRISLAAWVVYPVDEDQAALSAMCRGLSFASSAAIRGVKDYLVVLADVTMHIPSMEDDACGLFGLLGEEPVKAVEATDTGRIADYHRLWEESGSPEDSEAAAFFGEASDPARFLEKVEWWQHRATRQFLWDRRPDNKDGLFVVMEGQKEAWECEMGARYALASIAPRDILRVTFDKTHPSAAGLLPRMPRLTPVVILRMCNQECHLGGSRRRAPRREDS